MMNSVLRKGQLPILLVNLVVLGAFAVRFSQLKNYEFLMYIGVIVFFIALILFTNRNVQYPNTVLWGLTLWAAMHMAGGGIPVGDGVLYGTMLIPLAESVFRYDQLVHIVGFGVATLALFVLLKPHLDKKPSWAVAIVLVMAGLGVGALNEIIEFAAVVVMPSTGVGGYVNTALDLVADLVGALLAVLFLQVRNWKLNSCL